MGKSYHKALVIFIDILGSQNREDFDILYHVNSIFHNQLEKKSTTGSIPYRLRATYLYFF